MIKWAKKDRKDSEIKIEVNQTGNMSFRQGIIKGIFLCTFYPWSNTP